MRVFDKNEGVLRILCNAKGKEDRLLHLVIGGTSFRCENIVGLEVSIDPNQVGADQFPEIHFVDRRQVPAGFVSVEGTWIVKEDTGDASRPSYARRKGKFMFRVEELQGLALTETA